MLSRLQEEIARVVSRLPEATEFALAGGGALISKQVVDRETEDLGFFGLEPYSVDRLLPVVIEALSGEGLAVSVARSAPGFARLSLTRGEERTELDLAADARLLPVEDGPVATTLAGEELAVDKVFAIFDRAAPRDFVDLAALEPRYGLERLFALAAEKDPGFDPTVFAEMAGRIHRFRPEVFPVPAQSTIAYSSRLTNGSFVPWLTTSSEHLGATSRVSIQISEPKAAGHVVDTATVPPQRDSNRDAALKRRCRRVC